MPSSSSNGTTVDPKARRPMVPNRLRYLRERGKRDGGLWLTIQEVARCLDIAQATVSRHENNERSLSEADVEKYAQLYKVQTHQIFKGLTDSKRR